MFNLPVILLKGTFLLPNKELRLEISDKLSKSIIDEAEIFHSNNLLIVSRTDDFDNYEVENLPNIGVFSTIEKKYVLPDGRIRVIIKGKKRVKILKYLNPNKDNLESIVSILQENKISSEVEENLVKKLYNEVDSFVKLIPSVSNSLINEIENIKSLSLMTDIVCNNIISEKESLYPYLIEVNPIKRLELILNYIYKEKKMFNIDNVLNNKVQKNLNEQEKKYVLREKVKLIRQELGEIHKKEDEIQLLREKVNKLDASSNIKNRILAEISRYENSSDTSLEVMSIRTYIDWMLSLPWNKKTKDYNNISVIKKRLDKSHYGLEEVKQRIIEYLAVKKSSKNLNSPIICLVGPPGTGKTTLAYSIAKSINKKFVKLSVGGVNDEAIIKGHTRTYMASMPGGIVDGLKRVKTSNPVFLIDEIDKMTSSIKGDPESSLLEVLDPTQNKYFKDNYIDEEIDLSNVLFITTANDISNLSSALKDRLEVINISGYTELEKLSITRKYLLPTILKRHGLLSLDISDDEILEIIKYYTKESGLRELERMLSKIVRKIVLDNSLNNKNNNKVQSIKYYLGNRVYTDKSIVYEIGVSNALACTNYGGDVQQIETTYYEGNKLIITGNASNTIKESAQIALSYIKANYKLFNIDKKVLNNTIHINIPDIATKKDGPSAGVSITSSIISALSNMGIESDIAFTGEITLRGSILPVGGIKEKVIGAYLNGIKIVFIPYLNKNELDTIPDEIKDKIKFIPVSNYKEVFKYLNKESS